MTVFEREATIRWLGHPPEGVPRLSVGSESIGPSLPLSVDVDAVHPVATSPGELLAGAIGAIFSWLAAEELVLEGAQARELVAEVRLSGSGEAAEHGSLALSGITCRLLGRVPQITPERLDDVARLAMGRCIEIVGLRTEGLAVTVEAVLEGA